jgi:uncharacterized membrane protein (DUF2068 family)
MERHGDRLVGGFESLAGNLLYEYDFTMASRTAAYPRVLYLIAAFKLIKGLLLAAVAIGALRLLHRDAADRLYFWANAFRVDPGNRYLHRVLARLSVLDEQRLRELSLGTFLYSALFLTEGTGLLLRKRWAEYFTSIATFSFIPLEVYEIAKRATFAKELVLLLNVAVVAYLIIHLYRNP